MHLVVPASSAEVIYCACCPIHYGALESWHTDRTVDYLDVGAHPTTADWDHDSPARPSVKVNCVSRLPGGECRLMVTL